MKTRSSLYSFIFLFLVALFISRPGEEKHRHHLVNHLSLRQPDQAEEYDEWVLKNLRFVDAYVISWGTMNGVVVTQGVLGRITVFDGDQQRNLYYGEPISELPLH